MGIGRNGMGDDKWTNIPLPKELVNRVKEVLESGGLGYSSVSEFVREAVRIRISEIEKEDEDDEK